MVPAGRGGERIGGGRVTVDELEAIRARTAKATEILATLGKLEAADPYKSGVHYRAKDQCHVDLLDDSLTKKVFAEGRLKMISDLEAELAAL